MSHHARILPLSAALLSSLALHTATAQSASAIPAATEFDHLHFRSIGPATMSGRIADLAVYEANPFIYYVGTSHGGVWKTVNNGTEFTPLLQDQGLMSIGSVAVSQKNPNLLWVGTGESNNRQSTSWVDGIYKSTDGGRTFQNMGLHDSKHIGRIVIDPRNDDVVLVAAAGPLFGPGGDRGVYKTTDGGRSWKQVLKGDEDTGANDIAMSLVNPRILYASSYQRRRTACCVNGGGPGSGVWKSTDGGDTWTRLSGGGFPTGPLGRIALDVYRHSTNILYASIEGPTAGGGRGGAGAAPDSAAGGEGGTHSPRRAWWTWGPRRWRRRTWWSRGRRSSHNARCCTSSPQGTTGIYRSDDGGETWREMSNVNPRPLYFSQVRVDPNNPDRVYMGGVKMQMTVDGGRSFETSASLVIHDDIHAIWIDPNNSDHVLIGGDGGLGVSYDMSKSWQFIPNLPVGLFYHVGYDMEIPYNICGGMQDNYDWCGPSVSRQETGIMNYDWIQIQGGDGFVAIPDLRDSHIIYSETQDGNIIRRNRATGESKNIRPVPASVTPTPAKGESFRWQWDTPMIISPTDPGVLLVAANRVFKSSDRGDSWTVISPDLTTNADRNQIVTMGLKNSETTISRNDGISQWPTIVALAASPKQPGVYYTGSEDGVVSVSRDGGAKWENITKNLPGFPAGGYVSKVVASRFNAATVYVTVDNHRLNDYAPYMWVSTDFGATFHSIASNLKGENVRTLTEDQKNPDVLYIGTETGIFLSLDRGASWRRLRANFPTVRVDEITLHPRDNAMLVATHGRALWILDHLEPIQEYAATEKAAADAKLFSVPTALEWKPMNLRNAEFWGHQYFIGENPPFEAVIQFDLKKAVTDLKLRIADGSGKDGTRHPRSRGQRSGGNPDCLLGSARGAHRGRGLWRCGRRSCWRRRAWTRRITGAVPGVPSPVPSPGYLPDEPLHDRR